MNPMPDTTASSRARGAMSGGRFQDKNALRSEFAAFYEDVYPRLVSQLRAIIGDPTAASEAVQRAMARAWIQWKRLRQLDDPYSWVMRLALRKPRGGWRSPHRGVRPRLSEAELGSMDPNHLAVLYALLQQPETERRSLVLRHMAGLPVPRIAEEEGVAMDTVTARLRRGSAALVDQLDRNVEGDKR
jgi:RNA polymerase sigma-70 factor, ECF subfamily